MTQTNTIYDDTNWHQCQPWKLVQFTSCCCPWVALADAKHTQTVSPTLPLPTHTTPHTFHTPHTPTLSLAVPCVYARRVPIADCTSLFMSLHSNIQILRTERKKFSNWKTNFKGNVLGHFLFGPGTQRCCPKNEGPKQSSSKNKICRRLRKPRNQSIYQWHSTS